MGLLGAKTFSHKGLNNQLLIVVNVRSAFICGMLLKYLVSGDNISVKVWYDSSNGLSYWALHNLAQGNSAQAWFDGSYSFTPGSNSAEWIGEDPTYDNSNTFYVMPSFNYAITFSGLSASGINSLFIPILNQYEQDTWSLESGGYIVQQLIPSYVTNGDGFNLAYNQYTGG